MQTVRNRRRGIPASASSSRAMVTWAAKVACGVALTAALIGPGLVQPAAAQDDDTIVLSAGGSELVVAPGGDVQANGAVAEAHAAPGFAETIAAGARAVADSDCGAFTEASAASAVAIPDAGAATEAEGGAELGENGIGLDDEDGVDDSLAVSDPKAFAEQLQAEIMSENDALQMMQGNDGSDSGSDPVRAEAKNQKDGKEVSIRKVEECIAEGEKEAPPVFEAPAPEAPEAPVVVEVPSTGAGSASQLASLFAAASVVAGLGSVGLGRARRFGFAANIR
jgi:hypothetical protein